MIWTAKIRLANGGLEDVAVNAATFINAKQLVEKLYGADSLFFGPMRPDPELRSIIWSDPTDDC